MMLLSTGAGKNENGVGHTSGTQVSKLARNHCPHVVKMQLACRLQLVSASVPAFHLAVPFRRCALKPLTNRLQQENSLFFSVCAELNSPAVWYVTGRLLLSVYTLCAYCTSRPRLRDSCQYHRRYLTAKIEKHLQSW